MAANDGTPASWQELVLAQLDDEATAFSLVMEGRVFVTRSESDPMKVYYLFELPWIVVCTCDGFRFRSDCKHARKYLDSLDKPKLTIVE